MKIIIAGAGAVGTHLARLMSRDHEDCTLVDEDAERLEGLDSEYDIMTMEGSPTSIKTLKEAGAEDADIFVAVTPRREPQHDVVHHGSRHRRQEDGGTHRQL